MTSLVIEPNQRPLLGSVPLPSDDLLLRSRLALAAMSRGTSSFEGLRETAQVAPLLEGLRQLGVRAEDECASSRHTLRVAGGGLNGLRAPTAALDVREQADSGALLLGMLVGRPFPSELWVDTLVAELLMPVFGKIYDLQVQEVEGGMRLAIPAFVAPERPPGVEVSTLGAFPWVKQAILIAGLRANSPTIVEETFASADHLERAMVRARLPLTILGTSVELHPPRDDDAIAPQIYGHVGSALLCAYVGAIALSLPGSKVRFRDVSLNPSRSDFALLCRLMGCRTGISPTGDDRGEPVGDLSLESAPHRGCELAGENVVRTGDGALALLGLAASAHGTTLLSNVVPQSRGGDQRIVSRAVGFLRAAGVEADVVANGVRVVGKPGELLAPLVVTTGGDARLAMLGAALALRAGGRSVIDDVDCLRGVFPRFVGTLRALGASVNIAAGGDEG